MGQSKWYLAKRSIFGTDCKSLWDERIVNQIFLIKLWYIGQIYTIAKFIKEEIRKTVPQLSIWKCRLGISDIDTQLNSLEVKWI